MVAWNRNFKIRSQGFFFVSPLWVKSKKRVLNAIGRPLESRLFSLLGKAQLKWCYETDLWDCYPKVVYFVAFRWRKLKKRVFNAIGGSSLTRLFSLHGKAHPKMVAWNRPWGIRSQGCFFVSPRWGKWKTRVLNAIWRPSWTRLFALLGIAHPKWCYESDLGEFDPRGVFSFRPDGESRNNAFWSILDDLRQPGFLRYLTKQTQNGGMKPKF